MRRKDTIGFLKLQVDQIEDFLVNFLGNDAFKFTALEDSVLDEVGTSIDTIQAALAKLTD